MRLWSEHLGVDSEQLIDALASEVHWYAAVSRMKGNYSTNVIQYTIGGVSWDNYVYEEYYTTAGAVDPHS